MANQPPARPWFRLPNLARQPPPPPTLAPAPPAQPPAPPQQPRISVIRPTFRPAFSQPKSAPPPPQSSATQNQPPVVAAPSQTPTPTQPPSPATPPPPFAITSPSPPPLCQSPPPVVASPQPPYVSPSPMMAMPPQPTSVKSPTPSKTAQFGTPTASPIKTTRSPPPISLPPTQLNSSPRWSLPEAEQKKVFIQETFNKKEVSPSSCGNSSKGHSKSNKHGRLKEASSDSEDGKNVRIITMTGENKGVLMELGFPSRRNVIHGHGGKHLGNFSEGDHNVGNDSEESEGIHGGNADRSKVKDHKGKAMLSRLPMSGYVNSNVQGINNSVLFNCSFTHHDPGVHFSLSRQPINDKAEGNGHGNKRLANGRKQL